MSGRAKPGTSARILDVAEQLVQTRGFNGVSYADIATRLHLRTASLHYHFPGKAELGAALVARYAEKFSQGLTEIDATAPTPAAKLAAYAALYAAVIADGRMCLCGMLAAEYSTLPDAMQAGVRSFIDRNHSWLATVLQQGSADGSLTVSGSPSDVAMMLVAGLEGAMLVARPYGDATRFASAARQLLAGVGVHHTAG